MIKAERERAATAPTAEKQRVAADTSFVTNAVRDRALAAIESEQRRFRMEQQRLATEERQREAQWSETFKRLEADREKIAA